MHALGPPEIAHICKLGNHSHEFVLKKLRDAGMDSMPGAGAEILSDRVRRLISKGKCTGQEWLDIMRTAHKLDITTSATMMFGHVETKEERFDHLVRIREVQEEKPKNANGFLAFIPWPFMDDGTLLKKVKGINNSCTQDEYLKTIAISRIMLPNIKNIQTSWLTVGGETAQLTLHGGANDMGSIMLEENVVSAAGAPHRFTANSIQKCIEEAGFVPKLRTQLYKERVMPKMVEQKNKLLIMFTGIIEDIATVVNLKKDKENLNITCSSNITDELKIDQSLSHNGICLTVVAIENNNYTVTAVKETLQKTNLSNLKLNDKINLERSLKLSDRLDGHIVQGHVDHTASCKNIVEQEGSYLVIFEFKKNQNIIVNKGSICVNGVSLTVVEASDNTFSVAIIPYTWKHTNFKYFKKGTIVNVEHDVIGKYLQKIVDKNNK